MHIPTSVDQGYTVFSIPVGVIYRPNEAKVRNLKAKDYLGKAKLIAASDRSNAFTGFQGSELKRAATLSERARDDRPAESISYAATNLVQKNLVSRARQQSEPPINRNTFPPTPPPDSDKTVSAGNGSSAGGSGLTGRAASVRAGRPPRLDLDKTGTTNGRTGGDMPSMAKSRMGRARTASESRVQTSRPYATARSQSRDGSRPPYYRDPGSRRQMSESGFMPMNEEGYGDDVYDLYSSPRSMGNPNRRGPPRQQRYIEEEDEDYASDYYEDDTIDEGEFEMMGGPPARSRGGDRGRVRGASRKPEIRKFRVKVHAADDIRYIMVGSDIEFAEFEGRIREKFGFKSRLRIRMRDEGDMITMADQDDLDMLLSSAREAARRDGHDMAKMEVCQFPQYACRT